MRVQLKTHSHQPPKSEYPKTIASCAFVLFKLLASG